MFDERMGRRVWRRRGGWWAGGRGRWIPGLDRRVSGPPADDQHLARRGPQRALEVAAVCLLELEARVQEQQLQLAWEVHMALEVAHVPVHRLLGCEAVVQEPDLGALLVRQVAGGLVADETRAAVRRRGVQVDLDERARRR